MEIPLANVLVVGPRWAAEEGLPLVWWGLVFGAEMAGEAIDVGATLLPDVVVVIVAIGIAGVNKPLVFVGGVVHHEIHDELDIAVMETIQQLLPVIHRPELVHDRLVVGDVVPVVGVR